MADKKPEKKEEKKDAGSSGNPELTALYWTLGIIFVLSVILNNFNGKLFDSSSQPVIDQQTGRVISTDNSLKFPVGDIAIGNNIILKDDTFVRIAPGQNLLGKQKRFTTAVVKEGPSRAFNQNWWKLDFENAPDGWVSENLFTSHVSAYKSVYILPITWIFIKPILWVISGILLILLIVVKIKLSSVRKEASAKLAPTSQRPQQVQQHIVVGKNEEKEILTAGDKRSNERWMHIVQLLQSHNQNDWRQAIIEADIILEEMLDKMGYEGNSIGDKLKNVEPSDFRTINQAWDAHKVRNRIAHSGSEFQITHHEVEKVIGLYQEVFDEFYYI